jgi:hypothetical protein
MKHMLIFLILILMASCAARNLVTEPPAPQNGDGAMQLMGRFSIGHACPVDGLVLTAAHVAHPLYLHPGHKDEVVTYAWSDHMGHTGYLGSAYLMLARDLGILTVLSGTPHYYSHASKEPEPGAAVRWLEYDYRGKEKAFAPRCKSAKVLRLIAGHLILDGGAMPGASGGCLFNKADEVVGIVVGRKRVGLTDYVSVAVSVSGPWWPGGQF